MRTKKLLYSNGCSYTANWNIEENKTYPVLLAEKLFHIPKLAANPGSCNRKIIRNTIADSIELLDQYPEHEIFVLLQLTHLHRNEFAGQITKDNEWKYTTKEIRFHNFKHDDFESITASESANLSPTVNRWMELNLILHNEKAELIRLWSELVSLTGFFKQHNIDYLIFSGPKIEVDKDSVKDNIFYRYLLKDYRVLDLIDFNMLALTGKQVHPTEEGMQLIADYFFNLLYELK